MTDLTIEVTEPGDQGLYGDDELWITVTGPDPLPDFPTIRRLTIEQTRRGDIPKSPFRYFPANGGPEDPYQELWVCRKVAA
jgi:hypothetical protein